MRQALVLFTHMICDLLEPRNEDVSCGDVQIEFLADKRGSGIRKYRDAAIAPLHLALQAYPRYTPPSQ